jgi:hypothetical protein
MKTVGDQWQMIEYEIKMFHATYKEFFTRSTYNRLPYVLKNALEESAILHTRILCDIFLSRSKQKDDIKLEHFLAGWPNNASYGNLKTKRDKLESKYGKSNDPKSACWDFNKRLAHPTSHRGKEYDYRKILDALYLLIRDMIGELESLTGRPFPVQFHGPTNPPTLFWA